MTYEECLSIISEKGEYLYEKGTKRKLVIVPYTNEYFKTFNEDLNTKYLSKEDVKSYAKDNKYKIWIYDLRYINGEVFKL